MVDKPRWTVLYNVVSKENDRWIGTGWEFFDNENDAQKCYDRHVTEGNCPTKRYYYEKLDRYHLGAAHRFRESPDCHDFLSVGLVDASHIKSQWQANFMQLFPWKYSELPKTHKSDREFFNENWDGCPATTYDEFMLNYYEHWEPNGNPELRLR